jgi:hypothetical protein
MSAVRAILLVVVIALLGAGSAGAIRDVSWADSQHGWMAGRGGVLSTENGGRSWHRIGTFEVEGLVRTSARAGVVTELGHPGPLNWWTRDNGRHWYEADPLFRGEYVGSGRFLFSQTRGAIFQVKPWPPRDRPPRRCRSYCVWSGGSHSLVVARPPRGQFGGIANLPGGVLAVVDSGDDAVASSVLLRQQGQNKFVQLPIVRGVRPCSNFYSADPAVHWPRIIVFGCTGGSADKSVTWVSEDGGRSWRVYRT